MNGDELLTGFLAFLEKERPERFYPLQWVYDEHEPDEWKRSKYVPNYAWTVTVAKEACYGAYDAVLFRKRDGLTKEIIPVEVKADTDILDERIRTQLWVHIRNFGKSMLLLGTELSGMTELRSCGCGGSCGRAGWSGKFENCPSYKRMEKEKLVTE